MRARSQSSELLLAFACFLAGCGARTVLDSSGGEATTEVDSGISPDGGSIAQDDGVISIDGGEVDAGSEAGVTEVEPVDVAPPPPRIPCGTTSCDPTTEECCLSPGPGGGSAACKARGTCSGGVAITCSSSASCKPGEVCCLSGGPGGGTATCTTTCGGGPGPGGSVILCATDAECRAGERCRPTPLGFRACLRGPGGG